MGKNNYAPPSVQHVQTEGSVLQTVGMVLAAIGLTVGILVALIGGTSVLLALVPIGLLAAITGYLKQIAVATSASYLLAMNGTSATEASPSTNE
ncbi:hypothetical protein [Glutamicibacter sp.]|uniref:hypothetical protein n=1 Tax=Glutamicibacter sp. TaxID=1931995 RepID=UPI003D6C3588